MDTRKYNIFMFLIKYSSKMWSQEPSHPSSYTTMLMNVLKLYRHNILSHWPKYLTKQFRRKTSMKLQRLSAVSTINGPRRAEIRTALTYQRLLFSWLHGKKELQAIINIDLVGFRYFSRDLFLILTNHKAAVKIRMPVVVPKCIF